MAASRTPATSLLDGFFDVRAAISVPAR